MSRCVDVIVVGAGFAGLAAAMGLREAGLSTAIFEARDRVGGRVAASRNGLGEFCDVGGQYLCDDMTELMGIIRSQGKSLIELEMRGRYRGQPSPRTASETSEDPTANFFSRAWETYEILGTCMREGASKITVAGWIGGLDEPPTVKVALRSMLECICCRSVEDIPLWHLIEHCKRIKSQKDEMQYFVRETLHSVAVGLANANGDALRLKSPVTKIRWWDSGVELEVGGELWQAREVILAAPPVVVPKITFEPLLSDSISKALAAYRPGDVIKIIVRYADPFWSQKGWNGTAQWLEPSGLFVGDASPTTTQPLLVGFAGGPLARTWHTCPADERQAYVLSLIADAFGPEAHSPLDYLERDWVDDPWSGGGYNASIADQNATDAEAVLRAGLPPISFACSELAQSFPGYVEGAILSGMSSAQTVASRLRS